jgi:uncharacterized protein YjbJ (UPF0337 family)
MDKDRIEGAAKQLKGKVKEKTGELVGDEKLAAEGRKDKAIGKLQNVAGGLKDSMRDK